MKIATEVEITPQRIADLMVTACEFNDATASWCSDFLPYFKTKAEACKERPWYSDPWFWEGEFTVIVSEIEGDNGERVDHTVGNAEFEKGFQILAKKYPHHFNDIVEENYDALTADLLLQCIVFGEEKYA